MAKAKRRVVKRNSNGNLEMKWLHLLILVGVIVVGIAVSHTTAFLTMDKRLSVHETEDKYLGKRIYSLERDLEKMEKDFGKILEKIGEVKSKIDSLVIELRKN